MSRSDSRPDQDPPNTTHGRSMLRHLPAVLMATLCGLIFYEAATSLAEQGYASGTPISNAALYPRLLAGLLLVLLAFQIIADVRATDPNAGVEDAASAGSTRQTAITGISIVACVMLLPIFGFILVTPVLVLGLLLLFGDRQPATLIAVPLAIPAGCLLVFQGLFNVNLPRGLFGIALNF
ncbi:hypothetical protein TW79_21290 [Tritonibacter mobilis]|uniref:DUF1468 domain-containing protein n=2 Tax=Tritonibacter mobilis TaxID=379347 RepID=A0A1B1A559_9RHOB|nr:hypothetical protein K529_013060 [Tritonibacter mobilis F1926]KJZ21746.1 hypothetical protein TW79_21290 [Tritonibacter mobilis]